MALHARLSPFPSEELVYLATDLSVRLFGSSIGGYIDQY
ncbi:MAG: hypothetical protein BAJATHORv1_100007 [Candidatus Thorarchaeota archaeon]|nr:MAG: hypothetical protein BAJATHORv1_100007 [Candidatus Thorarchaeota archaeon]